MVSSELVSAVNQGQYGSCSAFSGTQGGGIALGADVGWIPRGPTSLLSGYESHASSGMYGCYGSQMAGLWVYVYLAVVEWSQAANGFCAIFTCETVRSSPFFVASSGLSLW